MRRLAGWMLGVFLWVAWPGASAQARVVHFRGPHPISPRVGKGMCWIEGPHVHGYAPHKAIFYVRTGPAYVFVGDPVEFEDDAPRHAYYGHHPVFWMGSYRGKPGHEYCYLAGPHYHWYAPPPAVRVKFKAKGGVLWWVGGHPKWYKKNHWRGRALAHHYRRLHVHRPVVTVGPPVGWVGIVVSAPGVEIKGGVWGKMHLHLKGPHGKGHWKHGKGHWKHGMGHWKHGPGVWGEVHLKVKGGMHHGHWKHGMHHRGHGGHVKVKGKVKW